MSLFTLRSGATAHPEDAVLQFVTDLIASSGVVTKAAGTTLFAIQAQATPDMTVKVKAGRAHIKGSSGNAYPVISDADTSVAISSNGSGSTRVDAIVLYIDKSASANSDASNIAKLIIVQGTTSAPSDGTIQSTIGSSNPFIRLADVSVGSGVTSIVSGNITDQRSISKIQFSDLLATPDNILPWLIDIDPFPTAVANTTFDGLTTDTNMLYNGYKYASIQNSSITFNIILAAGTWDMQTIHNSDSDQAIATFKLDGVTIGTIDHYAGGFANNVRASITGIQVATSGKKVLTITNPTKNASATGYGLRIQHIVFKRTA